MWAPGDNALWCNLLIRSGWPSILPKPFPGSQGGLLFYTSEEQSHRALPCDKRTLGDTAVYLLSEEWGKCHQKAPQGSQGNHHDHLLWEANAFHWGNPCNTVSPLRTGPVSECLHRPDTEVLGSRRSLNSSLASSGNAAFQAHLPSQAQLHLPFVSTTVTGELFTMRDTFTSVCSKLTQLFMTLSHPSVLK